MATPGQVPYLKNYLEKYGIQYSIMIEDVESIISEQRAQEAEFRAKNKDARLGWTQYYQYNEVRLKY